MSGGVGAGAAAGAESGGEAPVVFVAQWLPTFELALPVWHELRARGIPTAVLVAAEREIDGPVGPTQGRYLVEEARALWQQLAALGVDPLPFGEPGTEAAALRALEPCAVFLPTPYPGHRHPDLAPEALGLPLHFLNYGFRIEAPDEGPENAYFHHCHSVYMESASERDHFIASGVAEHRLVLSGHPGLDVWDSPHPLAPRPRVLWCPWWASVWDDGSPGYSTFYRVHEQMLEEMRARPDIEFVFRPHPLLFARMLFEGRWGEADEREFRRRLAELPNVVEVDADHSGHVEQLGSAWAMVTDGVSFFEEFTYTGKPLLLTQNPGNDGWNAEGQLLEQMVDTCEFASGVGPFLDRVRAGVSPAEVAERQRRARAILGRDERGAAPRVVDHLVACRAGA